MVVKLVDFFESIQSISTSTGHVNNSSNITNSYIRNVADYDSIRIADCDAIKITADIAQPFAQIRQTSNGRFSGIMNRVDDVSMVMYLG